MFVDTCIILFGRRTSSGGACLQIDTEFSSVSIIAMLILSCRCYVSWCLSASKYVISFELHSSLGKSAYRHWHIPRASDWSSLCAGNRPFILHCNPVEFLHGETGGTWCWLVEQTGFVTG